METSFAFVVFVCFALFCHVCVAQVQIPAKFEGFVYNGALPTIDSIVIEAFFDPLCPDSRDSWPPLKKIIQFYSPKISLITHVFPLPYHDNAFVASRALKIADSINSSTTYSLLEQFFKDQEKYYNKPTSSMSRRAITKHIAKFASNTIGHHLHSKVESGFTDIYTDMAVRTSFKYGCSRGVTGTPVFFVNGFPLPDGGLPLDFNQWKGVIDPLVG